MAIYFNAERCAQAFERAPGAKLRITRDVYMIIDIRRLNDEFGRGHYATARLVDKASGQWFLAAASPLSFRESRALAIYAAVNTLARETFR